MTRSLAYAAATPFALEMYSDLGDGELFWELEGRWCAETGVFWLTSAIPSEDDGEEWEPLDEEGLRRFSLMRGSEVLESLYQFERDALADWVDGMAA